MKYLVIVVVAIVVWLLYKYIRYRFLSEEEKNKLLRKMPGSPVSVAETILRAYTTYKSDHPDSSKADSLRYTLESRYQIIEAMKSDKRESILSEAKSLGHLVFLVVAHENPAATHPALMKQTVLDLYTFFEINAPN